jgi:hypothetical protein
VWRLKTLRRHLKHQHRVLFATGAEWVPAAISPEDVPSELGADHLEGEPESLVTTGAEDIENRDALAGGFATQGHGRNLLGGT